MNTAQRFWLYAKPKVITAAKVLGSLATALVGLFLAFLVTAAPGWRSFATLAAYLAFLGLAYLWHGFMQHERAEMQRVADMVAAKMMEEQTEKRIDAWGSRGGQIAAGQSLTNSQILNQIKAGTYP